MRCEFCGYEGPRKEFPRNMDSIYTTASGLKPRACHKCNKDNFFPWVEELEEDERELKALCQRMDDAVRAGDIDTLLLRNQIKEMRALNKYLNAEWVNEFIAYIRSKMREARKN